MKNRRCLARLFRSCLLAGVSTCLVPACALAQATTGASGSGNANPSSPAANEGLQDIVVTANKRSENINRVPLTIAAVTGDRLRSLGVTQTADLTKIVPGFEATQSQAGIPVYYLRGVGYDDVAVAARPAVTLYNDEAPLPYSVMAFGTQLDLERVEVLKGPQGLLFGSNSTGGAIDFIAAKPTKSFEGGLDGSVGRFGQNVLSGFVSGPISDSLGGRFALSHEGGGAWQRDYVDGKTIGRRDNWSGRLTLLAHPSDKLTARLTLFGATDRSAPQIPQYVGFDPALATPSLRAYPIAPRNDRAASFNTTGITGLSLKKDNYTAQAVLRTDYQLSSRATITALTSYAKNRERYATDGDGTELNISQYGVRGDISSFSQELRGLVTLDRVTFTAGANYERDHTSEVDSVNISDASTGLSFTGPPFFLPPIGEVPSVSSTTYRSIAGFGNVEYRLTDRLTFRGGARYSDTKTEFSGCTLQTNPGTVNIFAVFGVDPSYIVPGGCATLSMASVLAGQPHPSRYQDTITERNVSWRAGLDYRLKSSTFVYTSVSRGYKAGAFSTFGATFDTQFTPVRAEQLTAYEAGIKTDVLARLLHINAAGFYYNYANKQLQGITLDPILGPLQRLISIPHSRVYGFEYDATLHPTRSLAIQGQFTYINSRVLGSFVNFSKFGNIADFGGSRFPNTPQWQANSNISYQHPITGALDVVAGANVTYRSSTNSDFVPDNRLRVNAYTLVDLQAGIEAHDHRYRVAFYGRNIFNKYYWTNATRPNDAIVRFAGAPATYGIQASVRFR